MVGRILPGDDTVPWERCATRRRAMAARTACPHIWRSRAHRTILSEAQVISRACSTSPRPHTRARVRVCVRIICSAYRSVGTWKSHARLFLSLSLICRLGTWGGGKRGKRRGTIIRRAKKVRKYYAVPRSAMRARESPSSPESSSCDVVEMWTMRMITDISLSLRQIRCRVAPPGPRCSLSRN